jgi:hypothetical protein
MDLRFDLDDDQPSSDRVPGEDVDPTARAVASDLDLGCHLPAGTTKPLRDMRRASCMRWFALSRAITKERFVDGHDHPGAHRLQQSVCCVECQPFDASVFDKANPRLRNAGPRTELPLRPTERIPEGFDGSTDNDGR